MSTLEHVADRDAGLSRQERLRQSRSRGFDITIDRPSEEPEPPTRDTLQTMSQASIVGLFVIAFLGALYLTQAVVVPIILAGVVGTILMPVVAWLGRRGLGRGVSVAIVATALVTLILVLVTLLSMPFAYWIGRATELGQLIREKMQSINQPLALLEQLTESLKQVTGGAGPAIKVDQGNGNIVTGILGILTPAVSQSILFIGALIFYLVYHAEIRHRSVMLFPDREMRLRALRIVSDVERNMTVYFGTFTLVNLVLGLLTCGLALLAGLPNPLLWGVLAATVNYIPYVGVVIMVATLLLVGLLTLPTVPQALLAPGIYIAITTVEGHFLTPAIIGHRMTLNPFSVFLAIAFWTWMWGPLGAFVAVPILMMMMVTVRHLYPADRPDLPA